MSMTNQDLFAATNTAINAIGTVGSATASKWGRKWARKQYEIEKADALANWNRQNEYNSPEAQMARLKKAGLNPNLVYGNGADHTAGAIPGPGSADPGKWTPETPNTAALGQSLFAGYDLSIKQAQADNMGVQNDVLEQQVLKLQAETAATLVNSAKTEQERAHAAALFEGVLRNQNITNDLKVQEYGQKDTMFPYDLDFKKVMLKTQEAKYQITLNQEERDAATHTSSLLEAAQRIAKLRDSRLNENALSSAQYDKLEFETRVQKAEAIIKEFDAEMTKQGIRPGNAQWYRVLDEIMKGLGGKGGNVPEKVKDRLQVDKAWSDKRWGLF